MQFVHKKQDLFTACPQIKWWHLFSNKNTFYGDQNPHWFAATASISSCCFLICLLVPWAHFTQRWWNLMWRLITPALHGAECGGRCLSADYHSSAGHHGCDRTKGFTDTFSFNKTTIWWKLSCPSYHTDPQTGQQGWEGFNCDTLYSKASTLKLRLKFSFFL